MNMLLSVYTLISLMLLHQNVGAFVVSSSQAFNPMCHQMADSDNVEVMSSSVSRRDWVKNLSFSLTGAATLLSTSPSLPSTVAHASGGATAGGAYLLSAKQRYNERVLAGMTTYVKLSSSLENGNLDEMKQFFSSEEKGYWKDSSAAGYLLANAFRRSSSTPPDSLPSVKVSFIIHHAC